MFCTTLGVRPILMVLLAVCSCTDSNKLPIWSGDVDVTPLEREAIAACGTGVLTEEAGGA